MSMLYVMCEALYLLGNYLLYKKAVVWAGWPRIHPSISGRGKVFSHLHSIQTISEASPASYSICAQGKVAGPEANHLSLSTARGRMCGAVCAVPPHPSIPSLCGTSWDMEASLPYTKCFDVNELCFSQYKLLCEPYKRKSSELWSVHNQELHAEVCLKN
jgi:hypothetical protein